MDPAAAGVSDLPAQSRPTDTDKTGDGKPSHLFRPGECSDAEGQSKSTQRRPTPEPALPNPLNFKNRSWGLILRPRDLFG